MEEIMLPISPKINYLREEILTGNNKAVNVFWDDVEKTGTPLFESIKDDNDHEIITFLARAKDAEEDIMMFSFLRGIAVLKRLEDSDVYYKSYIAPKGIRTVYSFVTIDSLGQQIYNSDLRALFDQNILESSIILNFGKMRKDPLNQKEFLNYSIVESSNASLQPYISSKNTTPKGTVSKIRMRSSVYKKRWTIWVYLPPEYKEEEKPYPVILFLDGNEYQTLIPGPTILDNMILDKRIKPAIGVFIRQYDRLKELFCSPKFAKFIREEVVPLVRTKYNATTDPNQTVVCGLSAGGLGAAYLAFTNPEIFGNVLAQSGSFGFTPNELVETNWLPRQYEKHKKLPIKFYLDYGTLEPLNIKWSVKFFRDILLENKYEVYFSVFNGGHDYINWRSTLSDGLLELLNSSKIN